MNTLHLRPLLRRLTRIAAVMVGVLVIAGVALYAFAGLRVELDGGARPRLRFVESAAQQAERIERHREAQRAAALAVADGSVTSASATAAIDPIEPVRPIEPVEPLQPPPQADADPPAASAGMPTREDTPQPSVPASAPLPVSGSSVPASGSSAHASRQWPGFRGADRRGEYAGGPLLIDWPAGGLTPRWKQPVGGGYASFTAADGRAYTIEQRGPHEVVAAYDVLTGLELWTDRWAAEFREAMGGDGPRATPALAGGVLYALGATGELRALDAATGVVRWRTNILADAGVANLPWGMAASPLVVDDAVIVLPGGSDGRSVAAYDRHNGRRLWSAQHDQQSYASPMLVTLGGVRQLLVLSSVRLMGLAVEDGRLLWAYDWPGPNGINAAQPVVVDERRVFVSSGYGTGAALIEVVASGNGFDVREVWRNTRMKNRFASAVLHDGYIYGLDEAILACMDAETGALVWKGGRYGYGQLVLAHGRLIVLTEDGDLALVRATPDRHEEIVRFPVLNGKTWNPPALADGFLLVRNLAEMAAFDLRVR